MPMRAYQQRTWLRGTPKSFSNGDLRAALAAYMRHERGALLTRLGQAVGGGLPPPLFKLGRTIKAGQVG